MSFRFRLGPFTFGRTGTRLSIWSGKSGFSAPLSGKGRSFGKIGVGPLSWYFNGSSKEKPKSQGATPKAEQAQDKTAPHEAAAIEALRTDREFLEKLLLSGMPWRGVQERLKAELPAHLKNVDQIAYRLVPKVMSATFGEQDIAWGTEKRPSKSGAGRTTWIVVRKPRV